METTPDPVSWEKVLEVAKPSGCNLRAACCSVATPSLPPNQLIVKSAEGDETCRDFLSVFIPHASHQAAQAFYPEQPDHIERVLSMVMKKSTKTALKPEEVVFYHCRYLDDNRSCQVYEDRPRFCRDYPVSPMAILVKGCGYEPWIDDCKQKLLSLGYEIAE
ncbi:MAG: YkgJ family cysteine cluster protein [Vampirovibrio sp.]|nr:YkgJ family cysteine cluster protein [Vampirovibrio sp.]